MSSTKRKCQLMEELSGLDNVIRGSLVHSTRKCGKKSCACAAGGPLVTAGGEVVGIVTAILNPNEDQRTFVGIGFAVPIENAASAVGMPPF